MEFNDILISKCKTHHIYNGEPLYDFRFKEVLKFHPPGLASATDSTGAFHINLKGFPAYNQRFKRSFGFYESFAAVEDDSGFYHISEKGEAIYSQRYSWVGNYQEKLSVVRDFSNKYFHIDYLGNEIYEEKYNYAGDFKDGIAVVCLPDGKSTHIDKFGKFIHNKFYNQLDVFHKGFARAKDERGWFHINENGEAIYEKRFLTLEPFYNGQAFAEELSGDLVVIGEKGEVLNLIKYNERDYIAEISNELTGFWKSELINAAIELKILDLLPLDLQKISHATNIDIKKTERLLFALEELGLVLLSNKIWHVTRKGKYLTQKNNSFIIHASRMWEDVSAEWKKLKNLIINSEGLNRRSFKECCIDEIKLARYKSAIAGYTQKEFSEIINWPEWKNYKSILGFGHSSITLIQEILKLNENLRGAVINEDLPLYYFEIEESLKNRLSKIYLGENMGEIEKFDCVILPKFLHYFNDKKALENLKIANDFLKNDGTINIFEYLRDSSPLLDINMMVESGGELRNEDKLLDMLDSSGFSEIKIQKLNPYLVNIKAKKKNVV